jgi:hypothetical protein
LSLCRKCGAREVAPAQARLGKHTCSRCIAQRPGYQRYVEAHRRQNNVRNNARRIIAGTSGHFYAGMAATADEAAQLKAYIRRRLREFRASQSER